MHLYLVRHAMAQHNLPAGSVRKSSGNPELDQWEKKLGDTSLTAQGQIQVALLGQRLKDVHFDAVLSSPLRRALDTAKAITSRQQNPPTIECLPDLMEIGTHGRCWLPDSLLISLYEDIRLCPEKQPTGWPAEFEVEQNEEGFRARAERVREYLLNRFTDEQTVLIASHGAFMGRYLLPALANLPQKMRSSTILTAENASLSQMVISKEKPTLINLLNDISHLGKYRSRDALALDWSTLEGTAEPLDEAELDMEILKR